MTLPSISRQWLMLGFIALSVLIFLAVPTVGRSKLAKKSNQLTQLKLQDKTLQDQLNSLTITKAKIQKYSYFNDVAKTVIPNDKDQAAAVVDIFQMATKSGIALQDISFPASNLGVRATTLSPSGTSSSTTITTPSSSSSSAATALSQAKIVPGIPGLYSLQIIITPQFGTDAPVSTLPTYPKFLDFLNRIEHDRRTAQITAVTIQPSGSALNFSLTINIFIKP